MKILITCFEPFGNLSTNSSLEVITSLPLDQDVSKLIVPVSYQRSFEVIKTYLNTNQVDLIILTGQAMGRSKIAIEQKAKNLITANVTDNDNNNLYNTLILKEGNNYLETKIDLNTLINNVASNNVYISDDAGGYVCNYLYYQVLANYPSINSCFIHLPLSKPLNNYPFIDKEIQKQEIEKIILNLKK